MNAMSKYLGYSHPTTNPINSLQCYMLGVDLLNLDASGPDRLSLRYNDAEDAVLQSGLDSVVLNASREVEAARELADRAFLDPELRLRSDLLLLNSLRRRSLSKLLVILDCRSGDVAGCLRCVFVNGIFDTGLVP